MRALALSRLGLRLLEVDDLGVVARLLAAGLRELALHGCYARYSQDGQRLQKAARGSPFGGLRQPASPAGAQVPAVLALELDRRDLFKQETATLVAADDARQADIRWLVTALEGAPPPSGGAAIVAPLIAGRRRTGWLIVSGSLTEHDVPSVSALASQAAAAARNADLLGRLKEALRREHSTAELLERLEELFVARFSSEADFGAVLPRLTGLVAEALGAAAALVYLLGADGEQLELAAWSGLQPDDLEQVSAFSVAEADGVLHQALQAGEPSSVDDLSTAAGWDLFAGLPVRRTAQSLLALPLQVEVGKPLGLLLIVGDRTLTSRPEAGALATRYARHLAAAIGADRQQDRRTLAARSEAVSELARSIPHELGQPLAIVSGYAELIAEGLLSGEQLKEACEEIVRGCSELAALTQRLGRLSRYETKQFGSDRRMIDWQLAAQDV